MTAYFWPWLQTGESEAEMVGIAESVGMKALTKKPRSLSLPGFCVNRCVALFRDVHKKLPDKGSNLGPSG